MLATRIQQAKIRLTNILPSLHNQMFSKVETVALHAPMKIIRSNAAPARRFLILTATHKNISNAGRSILIRSVRPNNRLSANRTIVRTKTVLRIITASAMGIHAIHLHRDIHILKEEQSRANRIIILKRNNRIILRRSNRTIPKRDNRTILKIDRKITRRKDRIILIREGNTVQNNVILSITARLLNVSKSAGITSRLLRSQGKKLREWKEEKLRKALLSSRALQGMRAAAIQ